MTTFIFFQSVFQETVMSGDDLVLKDFVMILEKLYTVPVLAWKVRMYTLAL